jgi:heme-degrading monooxygenase HmoA
MSIEPVPSDGDNGDVDQVTDIGDEGLFAGTKIDSEEEALASDVPVEAATTASDTQAALYTLGMWRVKAGQQADFIAAWQTLGDILRQLPQPPAGKTTLVQSVSDPSLFYSLGLWLTLADIEAMQKDDQAQAGLEALRHHCTETLDGAYSTVAEAG